MSYRRSAATPLVLFTLLCAAPLVSQDPAREPQPVFDQATDARPAFDGARKRAAKDNRRVLLVFGGDWSVWCQRFHELTQRDRDVQKTIQDEFETVLAAVGPAEMTAPNAELARSLGAEPVQDDLPLLLVVTPEGEVVAKQSARKFEEAEGYAPAPLVEFLAHHTAPRLDAREVLAAARAQAAADGRRLFVHLSAPWCGWCTRLEEFLALPDIEPLFAKDLIDVKIDVDRMVHGKDVAKELRGDREGGIPWIVITDAELQEIVSSDGPEGNVGYPVTEAERAHFMAMLEKARENLTPEDLVKIRSVLDERGKRILDERDEARRVIEERRKRDAEKPKEPPDDGAGDEPK